MSTFFRYSSAALLFMAVLLTGLPVQAQTTTQHVTVRVHRVMRISISGDPRPLSITELPTETTVASVTDQSTYYSLFTNVGGTRITASIDTPVPEGTSLNISLGSSLGASRGMVDLSNATQAVEVVSGIQRGVETNRPITYTFAVDIDEASSFENQTRTVTLTILE